MKTYGDFDKFMDKAKRVSRYVLPGVAVALTASCTPEMINALAKTVEIPEVSPLPSDIAKTPMPSPTDVNYELTPTTQVATEIVSADDTIQIDLNRAVYPPLSNVQENFENGLYNEGLETIKQWVGVWKKMGVFEGLEIDNNSLSPVPLEGRARVVCVDTRKKGGYSGVMFCPPLDLVNGGLKTVPEDGKWDESDKPLLITFQGTEELVTKGSGNELVYQFMDKYSDNQTRYFDSKTGQIIEGRSMVRDVEVVENEIVIEGVTGVSAEFLLDGNLKINEEAGRKYYEDFINSLANNNENKDYIVGLIGNNPSGNKLLDYLRKNEYILPSGLNLPYMHGFSDMVKLGDRPIEEPIKLDTFKIVVFGSNEWKTDFGQIREYLTSLKSYDGPWSVDGYQYSGWLVDLNDNRLVMVAGAKGTAFKEYPHTERMTIGGFDGSFNFERDSAVASGELIQLNKFLKVYNPYGTAFNTAGFGDLLCGSGGVNIMSTICDEDITQLFGQGNTMFEPGK